MAHFRRPDTDWCLHAGRGNGIHRGPGGSLNLGPWGTIVLIQLIWIFLGCMIDWIGILMLTVPIFLPIALSFGFDPVWFGVVFCMNMHIAYLTPPFALFRILHEKHHPTRGDHDTYLSGHPSILMADRSGRYHRDRIPAFFTLASEPDEVNLWPA